MSGELTQTGANRAVQAGVGLAQSAAAAMFVALSTADPAGPDTATLAAFGSVEVTAAGYARQSVTWAAPSGDPSAVSNDATITFGPFTADPPEVGYCFLCTVDSGDVGDVLAYWTLTAPRNVSSGDTLYFSTGDLSLSVD